MLHFCHKYYTYMTAAICDEAADNYFLMQIINRMSHHLSCRAGKKPSFGGKSFHVFTLYTKYTKKTSNKITNLEDHPIHHSPCDIVFYKLQLNSQIAIKI